MVTIKVNIVALIVTFMVGSIFYIGMSSRFSNTDMAIIAGATFICIRVYDKFDSLPAFKRGNKKQEQKK
jgi:hypothetical protein